jgi:Zn-dependent M28 family amino/carboxypeptidase
MVVPVIENRNQTATSGRRGKRLDWLIRLTVIPLLVLAGIWFVTGMPGRSWSGSVPPLTDKEQRIQDNLKRHIEELAGRIGERNVWRPEAMAAAAGYIRMTLEETGYVVSVQSFTSRGQTVANIEAILPGHGAADEIIVIGAHYDSVAGCPGANDNASGVATLLELARLLAGTTLPRSVRFVAFANEEAPFFYGDEMGSNRYAARAQARGERIEAMLSLETVGYYTDRPGSQFYPFPFSLFYPSTGNFIGFVGNLSSRSLVRKVVAAFRDSTAFPSEGVAAPSGIEGIHWSDHWSFWEAGYPAIMVTDTAPFRYPHYHEASDTPQQLDYEGLARVTAGLAAVVEVLAAE